MYNDFINAVDSAIGLLSADVLLFVAIGLLGAILIYQLIMCAVAIHLRKKNGCCCRTVQFNYLRRYSIYVFAWLFAIWAYFALSSLILPAVFLFLVYLTEFIFALINRGRKCSCGCDCETKKVEKKSEQPVERIEYVETPKHKEEKIKEEYKEQREESVNSNYGHVMYEHVPEEIINASPEPVKTAKPAAVSRPGRTARKSVHVHKSSEEQMKEERQMIEGLGEKIERQRLRAERQTEKMHEEPETPYAAHTREALHAADETVNRMDELQKRMDALRQTSVTREVQTTETVTSNKIQARSDIRSTRELLREKESLKKQYETLQNKLAQMDSEIDDRRADVGYYSGSGNFERTGKSASLSKISYRSKFDRAEVESALSGLSSAMEDLQRKIDAEDGN